MDIEELLTTTRSARKSLDLDAAADLDDIRDCLRIGLQAANGSNQQSWRWMIVTDPAMRDTIADLYRAAYLEKVGGQLITTSPGSQKRRSSRSISSSAPAPTSR